MPWSYSSLQKHRAAPAFECAALACVLQPPEGGQAATPSMQTVSGFRCKRSAVPTISDTPETMQASSEFAEHCSGQYCSKYFLETATK